MSLDNLNNKFFVPYKDFEANRLASGLLQLSHGKLSNSFQTINIVTVTFNLLHCDVILIFEQ